MWWISGIRYMRGPLIAITKVSYDPPNAMVRPRILFGINFAKTFYVPCKIL